MAINSNEVVAIISASVSILTSVIVFLLSQNYLAERNRKRLVRNIADRVEITFSDKHQTKKRNLYGYLTFVRMYKLGINTLLLLILALAGRLFSGESAITYWATVSIFYYIVFYHFFHLIQKSLKSTDKRPYRYVFKEYPKDYLTALLIFLLAFLYAFVTPIILRVGFYLNEILAIFVFIFIFVLILPLIALNVIPRDEEYVPMDLSSDLFNFFHSSKEYTLYAPHMRISTNSGRPIFGQVAGIGTDLLIISTDIGKEYINWESIVSFRILE